MLRVNCDLSNKNVLVTGAAGFIGASLVKALLEGFEGIAVTGLDNMNAYYDVRLKEYRLRGIEDCARELPGRKWAFVRGDLADRELLESVFAEGRFDVVINLAAQAGVRYSIENPDAYIQSNIVGFYNILECCRRSREGGKKGVEHLVYASSSSVYGSNEKVPYSVDDRVDNPVSLYAATKKADELLAHAYAKLYSIPCTGLRFFTVYGPAGRPDMAYFSFTQKLVKGEKIRVFNYGNCRRDFTYVDDIVKGVILTALRAPVVREGADGLPLPPYSVYNIGNSSPENLTDFIATLARELIKAGVLPEGFDVSEHTELVPMQPGDVPVTYADVSALQRDTGFAPSTTLREGLARFAEWYKKFYFAGE